MKDWGRMGPTRAQAPAGEVVGAGAAAGSGKRPRRPAVKFCAEAMREVLRWVAAGEPLSVACARPGLPSHATVNAWAKSCPTFGRKLRLAKEAAGWTSPTHPGPRYCEATAQAIYARLCEGQALYRICEDPEMPGHSTVYRWRGAKPAFAALLREARCVQAERVAEESLEIADAVTPADAYAVEVRLRQRRWTAGVFNPAVFGRHRMVEHEAAAAAKGAGGGRLDIRARHFDVEVGEDGRKYVVEIYTQAEQAVLDAGGELPPAIGSMRRVE